MKYVLITPARNEERIYCQDTRIDGGADITA